MAVYGIESLWILSPLVWEFLSSTARRARCPRTGSWGSIPFVLAWAPYAWPNYVSVEWLAGFLGGMIVISAGLVAYAVLRLRAEATRGTGSRASRFASWLGRVQRSALLVASRPLAGQRSGTVARVASRPALAIGGRRLGPLHRIVDRRHGGGNRDDCRRLSNDGSEFLVLVSGLHATFGLLLVSLFSPTVLAEERVRGSLDVLMTTPLSTDRIVLSKWWGAYRVVPALAILPAIGCLIIATLRARALCARRIRASAGPHRSTHVDRIAYVCIPVAMLLAQGAVVTSVGLALATWIRRVGRAVAVSVTCCAVFAFGWIILVELGVPDSGGSSDWCRRTITGSGEFVAEILAHRLPARGPDIHIHNVFVAARTEPSRLLHRSTHRASGDDRDLPWWCSP